MKLGDRMECSFMRRVIWLSSRRAVGGFWVALLAREGVVGGRQLVWSESIGLRKLEIE